MNVMFEFNHPSQTDHPYSVSEINEGIAAILEAGNTLVWVEGEISNFKPSSSGHCYFRLKDQQSQIPSVIWRSSANNLQFEPKDGQAVVILASIRVYQRGGYYQLDVHRMQPIGSGALYTAFEKLKTNLASEGLFDQEHKKPLPSSICTLGVVTSKRGAALKDIIRVVTSRAPQTDIVIVDVQVQGDKAAKEIATAIKTLNEFGKVDCIIAGRGGGSIEDLWAFNEEVVARAIYDSKIPVISAVGHETDFTIADFTADVRAPTPSAAAEIAVADNKENKRYFETCAGRFAGAFQRYFENARGRFTDAISRGALRKPVRMLLESSQIRDQLEDQCCRNMAVILERKVARLAASGSRFNALSPLSVLARGYSVVTKDDGFAVRSSNQVVPGAPVKLRFFQGSAIGTITSVENNEGKKVAF